MIYFEKNYKTKTSGVSDVAKCDKSSMPEKAVTICDETVVLITVVP